MSDHWHYSSDIHGGAEEHHRHYDLERDNDALRHLIDGLRQQVSNLEDRVHDLEKHSR